MTTPSRTSYMRRERGMIVVGNHDHTGADLAGKSFQQIHHRFSC